MGSPILISVSGAALILQPRYPKRTRLQDGTFELTYFYSCWDASAESLVPTFNSAPPGNGPGGAYSTLKCQEVELAPSDVPGWATVTVKYRVPDSAVSFQPKQHGDVTQEGDQSATEVPIEQHPDYATNAATWAAEGRRSFTHVGVTYTRTSYTNAFTWTESAITSGVGTRGAPTGLSSATANNWLCTGYNVRQVGRGLTEVRQVWQYDSNGWSTTIYA